MLLLSHVLHNFTPISFLLNRIVRMETRSKDRCTDAAKSRRDENKTKSIIALADSSLAAPSLTSGDLVKLPDPFAEGRNDRIFVLFPSTSSPSSLSSPHHHIRQLSSVRRRNSSMSSFFVNNWVCSNGDLHILNAVDPLFLLLPYFSAEGGSTDSWQPITQILSKVPADIQKAMDASQFLNFFDCYHNDDLILYKFQRKRALQWLLSKHGKVMATLMKQELEKRNRERKQTTSKVLSLQPNKSQKTRDGAFSSSFRLELEDPISSIPSLETNSQETLPVAMEDISTDEERILYISAIQILCQNLSLGWRSAFLSSLNNNPFSLTEEDLWLVPTTKINSIIEGGCSASVAGQKRPHQNESTMDTTSESVTMTASDGTTTNHSNQSTAGKNSTKIKPAAASQGVKQLAKVNTKGMKKMELFFNQKKS